MWVIWNDEKRWVEWCLDENNILLDVMDELLDENNILLDVMDEWLDENHILLDDVEKFGKFRFLQILCHKSTHAQA